MEGVSGDWGNTLEEAPQVEGERKDELKEVTVKFAGASVEEEEVDVPVKIPGLHPADKDAEVEFVGDTSIYRAGKSFAELNLSQGLLDGVLAMKFTQPSKIQAQALPVILSPGAPNLIAQAHHGSGKTAAFSLGMLCRVDPTKDFCQAICVCPVRELARQVCDVVQKLGKFTNVKVALAIPGAERSRITAQIVVGCAGTLLAKLKAREIDARNVMMFVADEADTMIDQQGLGEQTIKIKNQLSRRCQILLFSATFPDKLKKFADVFAPNAQKIIVKHSELSLDGIQQFYMDCKRESAKYEVLTDLYGILNIGQSIIFVHTVKTAKELTTRMRENGYTVSLLHGKDMPPDERDRVMDDFIKGTTAVLITTNVLARGIDILEVTLVINYDIPTSVGNRPDPETYIHRIGRSGRFGRKGVAINLVHDEKSTNDLREIARYFDKNITALPIDNPKALEHIVKDALGRCK